MPKYNLSINKEEKNPLTYIQNRIKAIIECQIVPRLDTLRKQILI